MRRQVLFSDRHTGMKLSILPQYCNQEASVLYTSGRRHNLPIVITIIRRDARLPVRSARTIELEPGKLA